MSQYYPMIAAVLIVAAVALFAVSMATPLEDKGIHLRWDASAVYIEGKSCTIDTNRYTTLGMVVDRATYCIDKHNEYLNAQPQTNLSLFD